MITPEQLESYGYGNEEIFAGLEQRIMDDIVRRIKKAGVITRSADFQINELRRLGFSNSDIKDMLQDALYASDTYIEELYQTAIETDYISNKQLYDALDKRFIPFKENTWLQNMISAAKKQTKEEMHNLSQSLGFVIKTGDGSKSITLSEYFKNLIDQAIVDIQTGGFDYNTTLRKAVKQMSNSGIRWINYETGWHNRITVAARRSVMTAISQMSVSISDDTAKKLGIDTFEISAHANPRPTHAVWQGTVKTNKQLIDECGLGSVTGLLGANCYHVYYPYIKGVSKRAYTDEQLRKWADPTPKTYKGKEYTGYEAKQRMRQMETNMRAMREEIRMLQEGGGDPEDILNAQMRYRTAMYEYGDFAKKMGMKQQKERIYMDGLGYRGTTMSSKNAERKITLMKGYKAAQKKGDISVFITFDIYEDVAKKVEKELVGIETKDGIIIKGYKTHFIDRVIGRYESSNETIKGMRKGVPIEDIKEALINGVVSEHIDERTGKKSIRYTTKKCGVSVNSFTGQLIQTMPQ